MKCKSFKYLLPVVALLFVASMLRAADVTLTAHLDSTNLLMGKLTDMKINVSIPKGKSGHFPIFASSNSLGFYPVCGDSVELRYPSKIDTVMKGDRVELSYTVPVQSFDSGRYVIPGIPYVIDRDTIYTNSVELSVYPVKASADDPIDDYAGLADPQKYLAADPVIDHLNDSVADFLLDYWWLVLTTLVVLGVAIYAWIKYRRQGFIIPPKPQQSPYEVAIAAMKDLRAKKLWEQDREKEYFTDLTDILRTYLYRRFGINAIEMTSRQIMQSLNANPEIRDKRHYFRQILDMADFVKFAKVRPLPDDNIASFDNAMRFIEETKPMEKNPDESESDKTSAAESGNVGHIDSSEKKGGEK